MSTFEKYLPHWIELRQRLLKCLLCFLLLCGPLLYYCQELYSWVATPLIKSLPQGGTLIATQVVTPFTTPLKLALYATFNLTVPVVLYQLWAFVAPGLYPNEKQAIRPIILLSTLLFYSGMAFAHWVVLPMALSFFANIAPSNVMVMTDITHYLDFILSLYFAFGLAFQVPMVTWLIVRLNIVSIASLQQHRPYIIIGAFVVGMLLTPPDVISQILLALPLLGLFEGGLLLAKWQQRTKQQPLTVKKVNP